MKKILMILGILSILLIAGCSPPKVKVGDCISFKGCQGSQICRSLSSLSSGQGYRIIAERDYELGHFYTLCKNKGLGRITILAEDVIKKLPDIECLNTATTFNEDSQLCE